MERKEKDYIYFKIKKWDVKELKEGFSQIAKDNLFDDNKDETY